MRVRGRGPSNPRDGRGEHRPDRVLVGADSPKKRPGRRCSNGGGRPVCEPNWRFQRSALASVPANIAALRRADPHGAGEWQQAVGPVLQKRSRTPGRSAGTPVVATCSPPPPTRPAGVPRDRRCTAAGGGRGLLGGRRRRPDHHRTPDTTLRRISTASSCSLPPNAGLTTCTRPSENSPSCPDDSRATPSAAAHWPEQLAGRTMGTTNCVCRRGRQARARRAPLATATPMPVTAATGHSRTPRAARPTSPPR
jgi:hypothetical protein